MQTMNLTIPLSDLSGDPDHDNLFAEVHIKYHRSADAYDQGAWLLYDLQVVHSDMPLHDTFEAEVLSYAEKLWQDRVG
jgi:hypothetical protein